MKLTIAKTSAFFSVMKLSFFHCIASPVHDVDEAFEFFKQLLLRHSVQRPPYSEQIFSFTDIKTITEYAIDTLFRHYKLYKYAYTKKIRLDFHMGEPPKPPPVCDPKCSGLSSVQDASPEDSVESPRSTSPTAGVEEGETDGLSGEAGDIVGAEGGAVAEVVPSGGDEGEAADAEQNACSDKAPVSEGATGEAPAGSSSSENGETAESGEEKEKETSELTERESEALQELKSLVTAQLSSQADVLKAQIETKLKLQEQQTLEKIASLESKFDTKGGKGKKK